MQVAPDEELETTEAPATRRWALPGALGLAAAAGTGAIAAVNPTDGGAPICLTASLFGFDCPFCGGLRSVNALASGDLLAAADHNVLLAVALPLVAILWAWWLLTALRGRTLRLPVPGRSAWIAFGVVMVAFTVARNLGGESWIGWLGSDLHGPG